MSASSPVNINVPFVAALQADGTAALQTVQQDTYVLGSADVILSAALDAAIINAFEISHEDGSNNVVALNVTMANKAAFAAALSAAMQAATISTADPDIHAKYTGSVAVQGAGAGTGLSLENYIKAAIHTDVIAALDTNTIAAELEASDVGTVTLSQYAEDCTAAANAMWDGLAGVSDALRRLIATQVGNARFTGAGEGFTSALPLESGDSMTFQFSLNSNLAISESAQNLAANPGDEDDIPGGTITEGVAPGVGTYTSGTTLAAENRVVRVVLTKA